MSKKQAQILNLSELMTEKIGDPAEERVSADKDLKEALSTEPKKVDYFELDKNKEEFDKASGVPTDTPETKVEDKVEPKVEPETKVETEPKVEAPVASATEIEKSELYKQTLKTMYGDSIKYIIETDAEGNDKEISIEEAVLTESYFKQLVEAKQANIQEEAAKDKISAKGVSEFTKNLVEIDRNGGDISELIKAKETYSDPLADLDLDDPADQEKAVYLRMMAGGQDADTTRRLIDSYKREGVLEDMARSAKAELEKAIEDQVELAKESARKEAEEKKSLIKDYKKEIRASLDRYQLNENIKGKIVKLATSQDENGRFELDKRYYQHRENPDDAADLALYLLDKKEYNNQVSNTAVEQTKLNTAHKLRVSKDPVTSGTSLADESTKKSSAGTVSISGLNL